jgi:hypothetical protein
MQMHTVNEFKPAGGNVTEASNPASWSSTPGFQKQYITNDFKVLSVPFTSQANNLSNWNTDALFSPA